MRLSASPFARISAWISAWSVCLILQAPVHAAPSIFIDLPAVWNSAVDRAHTRSFGAAVEIPWAERYSAVARAHTLHVRQGPYSELDRTDAFYALGNPRTFLMWEFQASGRMYPWEWLPGFYVEGLTGYKRAEGRDPDAAAGMGGEIIQAAEIRTFKTQAFGIGAGFGYRWIWGHSRIALGFAFAPEWVRREGKYADGGWGRKTDFSDDMLRFNSLELGLGF